MLKKILKKYDWLLLVASCIYNLPLKFFVLNRPKFIFFPCENSGWRNFSASPYNAKKGGQKPADTLDVT